MSNLLDQPLKDFQVDLDRLNQLLGLLSSLRDFGSVEVGESERSSEFQVAATAIRDGIRTHSSDISVLSGSLLLYLSGRFEHFVRMNFQGLCDWYAAKCSSLSQLPKKMQKNLQFYTSEVSMNYVKYGFDEVQAFGFMACYVESRNATQAPLSVNSACLSVTQNNMRPEVLNDVFKRVGIENLWQEISKQSVLKIFFETDKDAVAEKEAKSMLEEMMSARNGIAHPTATPSFPDLDKIKKFLSFTEVLAQALSLSTKTHAVAFKPIQEAK